MDQTQSACIIRGILIDSVANSVIILFIRFFVHYFYFRFLLWYVCPPVVVTEVQFRTVQRRPNNVLVLFSLHLVG